MGFNSGFKGLTLAYDLKYRSRRYPKALPQTSVSSFCCYCGRWQQPTIPVCTTFIILQNMYKFSADYTLSTTLQF